MAVRILIAGLVGGIIVFVWGAVAHMATPLGEAGLSQMNGPAEESVLLSMKASIDRPGLYFFPGMPGGELGHGADTSAEQQAAWEAKVKAGPTGLLLYNPAGSQPMSPRQLGVEFACNIAAALLGAVLAANLAGGYLRRVMLVTLIGPVAWLSLEVSYWNWYGFPGAFVLAELAMETIGWLLSGLAIAAIARPRRASEATSGGLLNA